MVIIRSVSVFATDFCMSATIEDGAVNNHNVGMYAPANQLPYFHYNVNDNRQKLTAWIGLFGNGDMWVLSSLTETLM